MSPGPLLEAHVAQAPASARGRLIALRLAVPEVWRAIVDETLRRASAAGEGKTEAATALGVSRRALYGWIAADEQLRALNASLSWPPEGRGGHRAPKSVK